MSASAQLQGICTMAWTPLSLLVLLLYCTGASAKLTCTLSREHSTYYIEWYQQQPGKAPWYVMQLKSDGSHSKGDGIPDRFSGSNSGADRYLTISNIQPEDEADYLCGEGHKIGVPFG